ncbi:prepilin-type N-terminal cleavage/methylation domain-containing protein [Candidatus Saccharibacteria bacterium]|nr:prepilin-type N-terminal cleavage/methylation domain-containing protein [Candidatus Saccharibacteria bacterium]
MYWFRKPASSKGGYTLVELLLYVAIFSLIIGTILAVATSAADQKIKNQITQEVDYQGQLVLTNITQAIRNAAAVNSPTTGNAASLLSLSTAIAANNPTVYDLVQDQSVNKIRLRQGANTTSLLTSSRVTASKLLFTNRTITGGKDSIDITFTLTYYNPANKPQLQYQKNFYGTTTLR